MLNWLFGDPVQKTKKDLIVLDRFANMLAEDLDKHDIVKARKHSEFIFRQIGRLNSLADNSFGGYRDIAQINKLKNLVISDGVIFRYASELRYEINSLTQQNATEQKLSLIKSYIIRLDKNFKAAEELAEWFKRNEKFVKITKKDKIPERITVSSAASDNIKSIYRTSMWAQLKNILKNMENDGWRRRRTKSYESETDLLGLELKGPLRLTYYEAGSHIRICEIYTNYQKYTRDIDGARKREHYKNFVPIKTILDDL